MPEYDCVPGPNGSCVGGDASKAELVLDVDAAIAGGKVHTGGGETFFLFRAYGENTDGLLVGRRERAALSRARDPLRRQRPLPVTG